MIGNLFTGYWKCHRSQFHAVKIFRSYPNFLNLSRNICGRLHLSKDLRFLFKSIRDDNLMNTASHLN